jgi:hypothetical protein
MRILLPLALLLIWSCDSISQKENDGKIVTQSYNASDSVETSTKNRKEHIRRAFFVGDIDNDNKSDSAILEYDLTLLNDSSIENECANISCEMIFQFGGEIPNLVITHSIGVLAEKTEDLNNDGKNEILIFSRWFNGYWNQVYIFTLQDNKWISIANTKAFIADDDDLKNRIVKANNGYYLLGDDLDENLGDIIKRKTKILIKN